jgi:hypothetical protein
MAIVFITAFSIAAIMGYIFILILPDFILPVKELMAILPLLASCDYSGYMTIPRGTTILMANNAGDISGNSPGRSPSKSPTGSPGNGSQNPSTSNNNNNPYSQVANKVRE